MKLFTTIESSEENPSLKWAYAICRLIIYLYVVCGTTFRTATAYCGWRSMDAEARYMLLMDISIIAAGVVVVFLDTTAAKLLHLERKRKPILDDEPTPH